MFIFIALANSLLEHAISLSSLNCGLHLELKHRWEYNSEDDTTDTFRELAEAHQVPTRFGEHLALLFANYRRAICGATLPVSGKENTDRC